MRVLLRTPQVYDVVARPVVNSVMEGFNGTIFAYGQTGTGKTHTMEGAPTPELQGIIPNCFDHVFETVNGSTGKQWMVRAAYLEIYNEEVRDLLSKVRSRLHSRRRCCTSSGCFK